MGRNELHKKIAAKNSDNKMYGRNTNQRTEWKLKWK